MQKTNIVDLKIRFNTIRLLEYIYADRFFASKVYQIRQIFSFKRVVDIFMFNNIDEMSQYLGLKIPEWVVGSYQSNKILILDYDIWEKRLEDSFCQILLHEFVHLAVRSKVGAKCPIWLNEGLAMYFADQTYPDSTKNEIDSQINVYKLTYNSENLYETCNSIFMALFKTYGIELILERLNPQVNFEKDSLFGVQNVQRILMG